MEDGAPKHIIQMTGFKMEEKEALGKLLLKLDCTFIKSEVSIETCKVFKIELKNNTGLRMIKCPLDTVGIKCTIKEILP